MTEKLAIEYLEYEKTRLGIIRRHKKTKTKERNCKIEIENITVKYIFKSNINKLIGHGKRLILDILTTDKETCT